MSLRQAWSEEKAGVPVFSRSRTSDLPSQRGFDVCLPILHAYECSFGGLPHPSIPQSPGHRAEARRAPGDLMPECGDWSPGQALSTDQQLAVAEHTHAHTHLCVSVLTPTPCNHTERLGKANAVVGECLERDSLTPSSPDPGHRGHGLPSQPQDELQCESTTLSPSISLLVKLAW